jgi:hypothetical protein
MISITRANPSDAETYLRKLGYRIEGTTVQSIMPNGKPVDEYAMAKLLSGPA